MKTQKLIEALREEADDTRVMADTIDHRIANAFDHLAIRLEGPKTNFEYAPAEAAEPVSARQHVANVAYPQLTDHHTPTLDSIPSVTIEWADADFVSQHLTVEAPGDIEDQTGRENQNYAISLDYGNHAALVIEGTRSELYALARKLVVKINAMGAHDGE